MDKLDATDRVVADRIHLLLQLRKAPQPDQRTAAGNAGGNKAEPVELAPANSNCCRRDRSKYCSRQIQVMLRRVGAEQCRFRVLEIRGVRHLFHRSTDPSLEEFSILPESITLALVH